MKIHLPVRETVFGLEDSLVSTLGVVVGVAAGTDSRYIVILSALVVIVVESLSMSAGAYLSSKAEIELSSGSKTNLVRQSLRNSFFMGVFYVFGGIISIFPFFFVSPAVAILPAVIVSVLALFCLGFIKGRLAHLNPLKSGLEMSLVSFSAALVGFLVGKLASIYLMRI